MLRGYGDDARFELALRVHHHHGVLLAARYRLLRHGKRALDNRLRHHGAHIQIGQQNVLRIGHDNAQLHLARRFADRGVGKHQIAFFAVGRAVFKLDVHFDAAVHRLHLAFGNLPAQLHDFRCRLGHIGIHRVGLLDIGHRRRVARAHQRAFGYVRLADKTGNRRGDAGVVDINLRRTDGRLGRFHAGVGRTFGADGSVVFLTADGIGLNQRTVARHIGIGFGLRRLGGSELGARAFQRSQIGRVFQLVERLAFAYEAAFLEQAAFDDAAHLRTHVGRAYGFQTAGQFDADFDILRLHGQHFHRRRGHLLLRRRFLLFAVAVALLCLLRIFSAAAGRQSQQHGGSQSRRTPYVPYHVFYPYLFDITENKPWQAV